MAQTLKLLVIPGSFPFLMLGLVLGVAMLYGRDRLQRWGRGWLTVLVALYGLLAMPIASNIVSAPLTWRFGALASREAAKGATTIVVLTTGSSVYRAAGLEVVEMGKSTSLNAIEAARVYHLLGAPGVIATGGIVHPGEQRRSEADVLCDGLVRLGIPRDHIVVESRARNTREQASFSADLLRRRGQTRVVLITDAEHMPRAMAMFREQGLDPIPSVSVLAETTPPGIFHQIRPTLNAFLQSDRACYEYAARLYYWVQGFLGHKNG